MAGTCVLFLLFSNAVALRRDLSILFSRTSIIILLYSIFLTCLFLTCLEKGIGLYGGLFLITSNSQTFHIFAFIISATILQLTSFFPRKEVKPVYSSWYKSYISELHHLKWKIINKMGEQFKIIEYPLIILFIVLGASFLLTTGDLVSIFLSIELQSYGLYLLASLYRNSELATSGGLTYFLLGGLSSCFIVFATSLLYANSGITHLDGLYVVANLSNADYFSSIEWYSSNYIGSSLVIMSVGFLFKISAAPFHFWSPDVYDAIPTVVTTFVAIVAKISILIFFLELVYYTTSALSELKFNWTYCLLTSSLLSLIIGTVVGLTQFRIKRLLAYSTISHIGFILLALSINSVESIQSFLFYLVQYTITNLNAFIILLTLGYSLFFYINNNNKEYLSLLDKNNSPIQLISQIKGYFYMNPILSLSLALTIFSFIGIPPLIGFFGKQMVLSSALDSGYIFLALVGILTSVIGAVYYLTIIKQIFFDKSDYTSDLYLDNISVKTTMYYKNLTENFMDKINILLSSCLTISTSYLSLVISLFIFIPKQWLSMANILALILINP